MQRCIIALSSSFGFQSLSRGGVWRQRLRTTASILSCTTNQHECSSCRRLRTWRLVAPPPVTTTPSCTLYRSFSWSSSSSSSSLFSLSSSSSSHSVSCRSSDEEKASALLKLPFEFPDLDVSTNRYELERHGRGESYHPTQAPALIVFPKSTEEIQQVMRYCIRHEIPMIPFGAGTSVEGHVSAVQPHTLSIDLSKHLTRIHSIPNVNDDHDTSHMDAYAVVDAGVTRLQLQEALKHSGFWFPVDPGANATLGGMVGTGASGTTTIQYGTMRDHVLELTAVLACTPDAPIIHTGTKALKNSAGYDLTSLLVGSEGTLGIVSQITVKLHPVPQHLVAITCTFPTLMDAAQAISTLLLYDGLNLMRCELLDAKSVQIFMESKSSSQHENNTKTTYQPNLFLELSAISQVALQEQIKAVKEVVLQEECGDNDDDCTTIHQQSFQTAFEEKDRLELWKARHGLYYAAIHSRPGAQSAILTDACVPINHLGDLLLATTKDLESSNVFGAVFGHAGDGNIHVIFPIREQESGDYWTKIQNITQKMTNHALAVEGTCTGEHGIGYGKMSYLKQQYDPATLDAMKLIKQALDPYQLLNPGKVLDMNKTDSQTIASPASPRRE